MYTQVPDSVRRLMNSLIRGLKKVLGEKLLAVYLGGSVAMGDFSEASSDIDFLVVTQGELSSEDGLGVFLLHRDLLKRYPLASRLEGDYTPLELLTVDGTSVPVPGCERGIFLPKVGEIVLSAEAIAGMREIGLVFYGPHPKEILPEVTAEDIRAAARSLLTDGPGACETAAEMAAEVLHLTRLLCTLITGIPVTRSQGATWALTHLDGRWHPVIEAAMRIRTGQGIPEDAQLLTDEFLQMDQAVRGRFL